MKEYNNENIIPNKYYILYSKQLDLLQGSYHSPNLVLLSFLQKERLYYKIDKRSQNNSYQKKL